MVKSRSLIARVDASGVPLLVARLFVGGMFAWLAYNKLLDPFEFLKQLREYQVFPEHPPLLINSAAAIVPWFEMTCAVALLVGLGVRAAGILITGMLLFFGPILLIRAWDLFNGGTYASFCDVRFDCGCGTGEVYICSKMIENTALFLCALIPIFSSSRRFCLSRLFTKRGSSPAEVSSMAT